jgi:hypothetical protein
MDGGRARRTAFCARPVSRHGLPEDDLTQAVAALCAHLDAAAKDEAPVAQDALRQELAWIKSSVWRYLHPLQDVGADAHDVVERVLDGVRRAYAEKAEPPAPQPIPTDTACDMCRR